MNGELDKEEVLIFLHIPYTGGSTLKNILWRSYCEEKIFSVSKVVLDKYGKTWKTVPPKKRWEYARQVFRNMDSDEKNSLELITGHQWFGYHNHINKPCRYVALVRDPVDRIVSRFNYLKDHDNYIGNTIQQRNMSFTDFLDHEYATLSHNLQTKMLSGNFDPSAQDVQGCLENVSKKFALLGFTEEFDRTVYRLWKIADVYPPVYIKRNVTSKYLRSDRLSDRHVDKILEKNELDNTLYRELRQSHRSRLFKNRNLLDRISFAVLSLTNRLLDNSATLVRRMFKY